MTAPDSLDSLATPRLRLRRFTAADRPPFAAINADPVVMRHLGGVLSRAGSDALLDRVDEHWAQWGYGLQAVELRGDGRLVGFIGLSHHRALPDDVELGWRLAADCWGRGLATEGAAAVRDAAFAHLGLTRLVSITTDDNVASRRVMDKLGFTYVRHLPFEQWDLRVSELVDRTS